MTTKRCTWVSKDDPLVLQYCDREWGVPVHNDRKHFEFLVLEEAQTGLSWSIVLKKREGYRRVIRLSVYRATASGSDSLSFVKTIWNPEQELRTSASNHP